MSDEEKALEASEKGNRKKKSSKPKEADTPESHFSEAVRYYYDERDYQTAVKSFEKAAESADDFTAVRALYWLGESHAKLKSFDKAMETFENLIKRFENHYLSDSARRRIKMINSIRSEG